MTRKTDHSWLRSVLLDLEQYAQSHDVPDLLEVAISQSARIAQETYPLDVPEDDKRAELLKKVIALKSVR